jgi:hypothetical protein
MLNHHHADFRVASVLQAVSSARAVDHDVPWPNRELRSVEGHVGTARDDHIDFLVIERMSVDPISELTGITVRSTKFTPRSGA